MYVWMNKSYGTCHENPVECSPLTSINLHHQTSLTCNNMQESSFFIGRSLIQTSHGRTVCEANVLEIGKWCRGKLLEICCWFDSYNQFCSVLKWNPIITFRGITVSTPSEELYNHHHCHLKGSVAWQGRFLLNLLTGAGWSRCQKSFKFKTSPTLTEHECAQIG